MTATKNKKQKIKGFFKSKEAKVMTAITLVSASAVPLSASAEQTGVTYFQVTEAMVDPLVSAINSGLTVMMPIGITCLASFIGINVVKRVIYSFI